ncbi:MAG: hypothetical protein ABUL73_05330 [Alphaproteobacteria bacterium]
MSQEDPMVAQYVTRLQNALRRYSVPESAEIVADVRSHIAEALNYGQPLGAVMTTLGPADTLARAYAVELLMHEPKDARIEALLRFLKIMGFVIAGSFLSMIVAVTLGGFGLSFLLAGMILIVAGGLEALGVHLAHVHTGGLPPLVTIALGPVALAVGWGFCWLLWLYVRMAARALRKALPGKTKA